MSSSAFVQVVLDCGGEASGRTAERHPASAMLKIRRYDGSPGEPFVFLVRPDWIGVEGMDDSNGEARRIARTQSLFRAVNERIESTNEHFGVALEQTEFVCECADQDCMERLTLTLGKYAGVRRVPTHFVVASGHIYREFERVVEQVDGYVVVEKFGEAGKEALKWDKRRPTGLHLAT